MLVKLKRDWFGPHGSRLRAKDRTSSLFVREVPDSFLASLPSDAEVYDEKGNLIGTAAAVRAGDVKVSKADVDPAEVKKAEALEAAKAAVAAAEAAVAKEASDKNVKALNEAKAALAKLEKE